MPSINYSGQSFAIDSRRLWILAAALDYARIEPSDWVTTIAAARDAGFNTILTACPWSLHEPRPGRFTFEGQADVKKFVTLCGKHGLRVILRPGPFVGGTYDGGGLPAWLAELPKVALREQNEVFLERMIPYMRRLISQVDDLQATRVQGDKPGPIIIVQSEHAWICSNPKQAETYLREVTRVIRESGINVPLINANDLWQDMPGTIDTWRGSRDLLVNLRQLRSFEPNAPLLVSECRIAPEEVWGAADSSGPSPDDALSALAECLAAGGQPMIEPFASGTNFGFLSGRLAGAPDRFVTTSASGPNGAMLNADGSRSALYAPMKRLLMFANHFGHVLAELDPLDQPIVHDLPGEHVSIVPLRGSQGRIVFIFAPRGTKQVNLVLDDGLRMPIDLGDQSVGWLVFDADLAGTGRLDYANLFPYAVIDRSTLVLHGAEGAEAFISIGNTPLHARVPSGKEKPLVHAHKGINVVICNQHQIDGAFHHAKTLYIGASGLDAEGRPIALPDYDKVWMIADGSIRALNSDEFSPSTGTSKSKRAKSGKPRAIAPSDWEASPADAYVKGESPRYASLDGPASLNACGAPIGYGWYRISLSTASARKRLCHLPGATDRVHLYLNGKSTGVLGVGPGAKSPPFNLQLAKGEHQLVALVDNMGRFADGNELAERKGLFEHLYEVRPMKAVKPKLVKADPVDPFTVRGYIAMRTAGQRSGLQQAQWTFSHTKKNPILLDIIGAKVSGTFVLNDVSIAYYAGATGSCMMRLMLSKELYDSFKRGKNVLRFAPDARQDNAFDDIAKHSTMYECVDAISDAAGEGKGSWAFAKWEPPPTTLYEPVAKTAAKPLRGSPCWWTATFTLPEGENAASFALEMKGLSKGQAYINGHNLGRYFTATATGKAIGPQTRLTIPKAWINQESENRIVIFDEHGYDPFKCKIFCGSGQ